MDALNWKVEHICFGIGEVILLKDGYITISFANSGEKRFVYPDAFERFLQVIDPEIQKVVLEELRIRKIMTDAESVKDHERLDEEKRLHEIERIKLMPAKRKEPAAKKVTKAKKAAAEETE